MALRRRREGFARTVKGLECWLDPDVAAAIRRSAREVQELISSEPAVEGLTGLDPEESSEAGAFSELQSMLASGTLAGLAGLGGEVPPLSEDPALARLFPIAYEDPEQADEYRRFTYTELHAAKVAGLAQLSAQLAEMAPDIVLDDASAAVWLGALNDLRLVIGSRIGITEDNAEDFESLPPSDMRALAYALYVILTSLQDSLVEALADW
ncbi:MAG: hypothetical protein QOF82_198 [Frankiales bacterium]|nr:hypothetical protein [Frankiales bacterium]MDX6211111.1 hypothetical protein [Frankiales bacterium]MDX6223012.1 hypothetical protein [Frankiales bacterium]